MNAACLGHCCTFIGPLPGFDWNWMGSNDSPMMDDDTMEDYNIPQR